MPLFHMICISADPIENFRSQSPSEEEMEAIHSSLPEGQTVFISGINLLDFIRGEIDQGKPPQVIIRDVFYALERAIEAHHPDRPPKSHPIFNEAQKIDELVAEAKHAAIKVLLEDMKEISSEENIAKVLRYIEADPEVMIRATSREEMHAVIIAALRPQ